MAGLSVVGLQWGDEGKGKLIDNLSESADIVVRSQAGGNAGHTVYAPLTVVDGMGQPSTRLEKFVFHHLPSGMIYPQTMGVIANGVLVNLLDLLKEIETNGQKLGEDLRGRLKVSDRCHVVMPYHIAEDIASEAALGGGAIGTTKQGIGPCMKDKMGRSDAIRMCDLVEGDPSAVRDRIRSIVQKKGFELSQVLKQRFGCDDLEAYLDKLMEAVEKIRACVCDTVTYLQQASDEGKTILLEGAQAEGLDIDHGTYPFVTAGLTTLAGVLHGCGLTGSEIDRNVGVAKAYCTRVGGGPFVSEDTGDTGERMRQRGNEFGATTGRPRRCGWMDLVMLKRSLRINGTDEICLTKADVLDEMEEIQVCVGYELDGKTSENIPARVEDLDRVKPVYKTFPGWKTDISKAKSWSELPQALRDYVEFLERETGVRVTFISNGKERDQMITRRRPVGLWAKQTLRRWTGSTRKRSTAINEPAMMVDPSLSGGGLGNW